MYLKFAHMYVYIIYTYTYKQPSYIIFSRKYLEKVASVGAEGTVPVREVPVERMMEFETMFPDRVGPCVYTGDGDGGVWGVVGVGRRVGLSMGVDRRDILYENCSDLVLNSLGVSGLV